jgi:hypothetical protein
MCSCWTRFYNLRGLVNASRAALAVDAATPLIALNLTLSNLTLRNIVTLSSLSAASTALGAIVIRAPAAQLTLRNLTALNNTRIARSGAAVLDAEVSTCTMVGGELRDNAAFVSALAAGADARALGGAAMRVVADNVSLAGAPVFAGNVLYAGDVALNGTDSFAAVGGAALLVQPPLASARTLDVRVSGARFADNAVRLARASSVSSNSALVGGGASLLVLDDRPASRASLAVLVSETTFANESVDADALAAGTAGMTLVGGAAVLVVAPVGSVDVTLAGVNASAQRVAARGATSLATTSFSNSNGGGAVAVACGGAQLALRVAACAFDAQSVNVSHSQAPSGVNANGGGALLVAGFSTTTSVLVDVHDSQFTSQSVDASSNAAVANADGGGALLVNAGSNASVVLRNTRFAAQRVLARASHATTANMCGGGAVFVSSHGASSAVDVDTCAFTAQQVLADVHVSGVSNANGGGALYAASLGAVVAHLRASTFDAQLVSAASHAAVEGNSNGGGAVYVLASSGAANVSVDACAFRAQALQVVQCAASIGATSNGGGALYVAAVSGLGAVRLRGSVFDAQVVNASRSVGAAGNFIGGGAMFASAGTGVTIDVNACDFVAQTLDASLALSPHSSNSNGGAAVYTYCAVSVGISIANAVFANQSVLVGSSTAALSNVNGGAALFAIAELLSVTLSNVSAAAQVVVGDDCTAGAQSVSGGGVSLLRGTVVSVALDALSCSGQHVSVRNATGMGSACGGGCVLVVGTAWAALSANDTLASDQFVDVSGATATAGTSASGGGVANLFVLGAGGAMLTVSGGSFARQTVLASRVNSSMSCFNGGGAFLVNSAAAGASVNVSGVRGVAQAVVCDGAVSVQPTGSNANGGGFVYVYSSAGTQFALRDAVLVGQTVHAGSNVAQTNFNGGGAVLLNGMANATVTLADSVIAGQRVVVPSNAAFFLNLNGGAGVYAYAQVAVAVTVSNVTFSGQALSVRDSVCLFAQEGGGNQNGGASLYLNAIGPVEVTVDASTFADSVSDTSANVANSFSNNGGAAVYVNMDGFTTVSIARSTFVNQTAIVSDGTTSLGTFDGGGAVYVFPTFAGVALTLTDSVFARCAVVSNNTVSRVHSHFVGGGALYIDAQSPVTLVVARTQFAACSAVIRNASAPDFSLYLGGGAVYAITEIGGLTVSLDRVTFVGNAVAISAATSVRTASSAAPVQPAVAGVCGGGALFALGASFSDVSVTAARFANNSAQLTALSAAAPLLSWYLGGAGVLVLSTDASARLRVTNGSLTGNVLVARDVLASQAVLLAGGAALVAGQTEARSTLVNADGDANVVDAGAVTSTAGSLVLGGALLSVTVLTQCDTSLLSLVLEHARVTRNRVLVGGAVAPSAFVGGGGVAVASTSAQQVVRIGNGTVLADNVLDVDLAAAAAAAGAGVLSYSVGGGALAVRSQSVVSAVEDFVALDGVLATRNHATITNARGASGLAAVGGGALLLATQVSARLTSCELSNNSLAGSDTEAMGGACFFDGPAELDAVRVAGNAAPNGGGALVRAGVALRNCTVSGNTAVQTGGAFFVPSGQLLLANTTLDGNRAGDATAGTAWGGGTGGFGGVVYAASSSQVTLDACSASDNVASSSGGVLGLTDNARALVTRSTFARNGALGEYGGSFVLSINAELSLTDSLVTDSWAALDGGAVEAFDAAAVTLSAVRIVNARSLTGSGGGVSVSDAARALLADVQLENCTAPQGYGGGLCAANAAALRATRTRAAQCSAGVGGGAFAVVLGASMALANSSARDCATPGDGGGALAVQTARLALSDVALVRCQALRGHGGGLVLANSANASLSAVNVSACEAALGGGVAVRPGALAWLWSTWQSVVLGAGTGAAPLTLSDNVARGDASAPVVAPGGGGALFYDLSSLADAPSAASSDALAVRARVLALDEALLGAQASPASVASNRAQAYGNWSASSWVSVGVQPAGAPRAATAAATSPPPPPLPPPGGALPLTLEAQDAFGARVASLSNQLAEVRCTSCAAAPAPPVVTANVAMTNGSVQWSSAVYGALGGALAVQVRPLVLSSGAATSFGLSPLVVSSVLSVALAPACAPGSGYSTATGACVACTSNAYAVNATGPCEPCPAVGAVCSATGELYVANNFWPARDSGAPSVVVPARCPGTLCLRTGANASAEIAGASLAASLGAVLATDVGALCRPGTFRDGASPLCGQCVAGYALWYDTCVPCAQPFHFGSLLAHLLAMFAVVVLQRVISQQGSQTRAAPSERHSAASAAAARRRPRHTAPSRATRRWRGAARAAAAVVARAARELAAAAARARSTRCTTRRTRSAARARRTWARAS